MKQETISIVKPDYNSGIWERLNRLEDNLNIERIYESKNVNTWVDLMKRFVFVYSGNEEVLKLSFGNHTELLNYLQDLKENPLNTENFYTSVVDRIKELKILIRSTQATKFKTLTKGKTTIGVGR